MGIPTWYNKSAKLRTMPGRLHEIESEGLDDFSQLEPRIAIAPAWPIPQLGPIKTT